MSHLIICKAHLRISLCAKLTFYHHNRICWNWSHWWRWSPTDISIDNSSHVLCMWPCCGSEHLSCTWHRCWSGQFQLWLNNFLTCCKMHNKNSCTYRNSANNAEDTVPGSWEVPSFNKFCVNHVLRHNVMSLITMNYIIKNGIFHYQYSYHSNVYYVVHWVFITTSFCYVT